MLRFASLCLTLGVLTSCNGCTVEVKPLVGQEVSRLCTSWLAWEDRCFDQTGYPTEGNSYEERFARCYDGSCGEFSGRDCTTEIQNWTPERVGACENTLNNSCKLYGDTFVSPECSELYRFSK